MTNTLIKFCKYHNVGPAAFAAINHVAQGFDGLPSHDIIEGGLQSGVILATDENIYLTKRGRQFLKNFIKLKKNIMKNY